MIDSIRLARTAYYALVRRVTEAQQRVVVNKLLVATFGDDAVPTNTMYHTTQTLSDAPNTMARLIAHDLQAIDDTMPTIRAIEELFKQKSEADLQSFADYIRNRAATDRAAS